MKPAPFEYDDPATLDEALGLLAEHGDAAQPLAGGQSLIPLLNFRLARPERIVDLNRIGELDGIRTEDDALRIGATTRQADLLRSEHVARHAPLLAEAAAHIGHAQIRNRGTVGGSVAHADPAAELPAALVALDARLHMRSRGTARTVAAADFFVMPLVTAREPDELLVDIEVPAAAAPRTGAAVAEVARRDGDFALAGAAARVALTADGACDGAAIALFSAGPTPVRAAETEAWLRGAPLDETTAAEAGRRASAEASPTGDVHASADTRRHLLATVVTRAMLGAAGRARAAGARNGGPEPSDGSGG